MEEKSSIIKVLFIGDVVGKGARQYLRKILPELSKQYLPDLIITNAENSADGRGMTSAIYDEYMKMGIGCLTSGNHIFDNKDIIGNIEHCFYLLRPHNYPKISPGKGYQLLEIHGQEIAIISLQGQVFMPSCNNPFEAMDKLLEELKAIKVIIVDFHAEATSEKIAMAYYLQGKVSAVIGTHTHVQTADERIFADHTAYISDVGMVGSANSILGMHKDNVLQKFTTNISKRLEPDLTDIVLDAVIMEIDQETGRAVSINRVRG